MPVINAHPSIKPIRRHHLSGSMRKTFFLSPLPDGDCTYGIKSRVQRSTLGTVKLVLVLCIEKWRERKRRDLWGEFLLYRTILKYVLHCTVLSVQDGFSSAATARKRFISQLSHHLSQVHIFNQISSHLRPLQSYSLSSCLPNAL